MCIDDLPASAVAKSPFRKESAQLIEPYGRLFVRSNVPFLSSHRLSDLRRVSSIWPREENYSHNDHTAFQKCRSPSQRNVEMFAADHFVFAMRTYSLVGDILGGDCDPEQAGRFASCVRVGGGVVGDVSVGLGFWLYLHKRIVTM